MRFWIALLSMVSVAGAAPLTLARAVEAALGNYPAVKVSEEQAGAAAAAIRVARLSYLPRADFLGQVNRATHNNVFGMLLQQPVVSPISGPVLGTHSLENVWGSALGTLVSWEPFDFGLRRANIGVAESARDRAAAQIQVTRLQVATAAADAFLTVLAAQQTVAAAHAAVERARTIHTVVESLARNQLRPGADESRARAELALAETQLIQAEQAVEVGRATLGQLAGPDAARAELDPGRLLDAPPEPPAAAAAMPRHPLAMAQNAAIAEVKAREKALDRSYFPRFNLLGTVYARGTGIQPDGSTGGAASGLGPNIQNWALGMNVTFAAFDFAGIRARKAVEASQERVEAARYRQVVQDLDGQVARARAQLAGAGRVALNTPVELEAARDAARQAEARYRAGLGSLVEVAEAQRLLTQTEIDDALARLSVWRAGLAVAAAEGDLTAYIQRAGK